MTKLDYINKIVKKYNLKQASQRDMPLFTASCVAPAYTKLLRKQLGFSYRAIGRLGGRNRFYTLGNEEYIAIKTEEFLEKNLSSLDQKVFSPARKIIKTVKPQLKQIKQQLNFKPKDCLRLFVKYYPRYYTALAIYNCFWRYSKKVDIHDKLSPVLVNRMAQKKEKVAVLWPQFEKLLQSVVDLIGQAEGFKGDYLRYLTLDEMKLYLNGKLNIKEKLAQLKVRRIKYFYLFVEKGNKESIFTDKDVIKNVYNNFFKIDVSKVSLLKGSPVYHGLVKGFVHNLEIRSGKKVDSNFVLVASMTRPNNLILIKRSLAIVTDEGGILCHAAIVAREFKKPCIVGTKIASKVLKDGDLVEVDADKGVVRVLKQKT
ncbi:MAG: PEP-utilizing enzyme [Candidatus Jacksonbacteria bacterium]